MRVPLPIQSPIQAFLGHLFVGLQYGLPQHLLSRLVFWFARQRLGPLTHWLIRRFVSHFAVDLSTAANPDIRSYPSFNAFFTRALAADARPMPADAHALLSPVDAQVSAAGQIAGTHLLQCKGQMFSLAELLGTPQLAAPFVDGQFATLYLSPRDYHRIHMPQSGRLIETVHVPGRLFSVNPTTVSRLPGLFARNERLVALFDTASGPMALVLVGAMLVGSIETVWAGIMTPPRARALSRVHYPANSGIALSRGSELGRFNLGSTVILLLPPGTAALSNALSPGDRLRARAPLGRLTSV